MVQTSFKFKSVHWYSLTTAALVVLAIGCGASDGGDASAEGGDEENLVTPVAPLDFASNAPWFACGDTQPPEGVEVVKLLDGADHFFGSEDRRTIKEPVSPPTGKKWGQCCPQASA